MDSWLPILRRSGRTVSAPDRLQTAMIRLAQFLLNGVRFCGYGIVICDSLTSGMPDRTNDHSTYQNMDFGYDNVLKSWNNKRRDQESFRMDTQSISQHMS